MNETPKNQTPARISREDAERGLAYDIIARRGLPRGEVVRVLKEVGADPNIIDQVASRTVPYGHT